MTIWTVITLQAGAVHEVEFFSERPRTPDVGGEPGNWPTYYLVYEGNVDGGDSVLVGRGDGALASCRHPAWPSNRSHCVVMSCSNYVMKHEVLRDERELR